MNPVRTIGVEALNDRLNEYVRIAASGETVLITDRSRVVAELGPPRQRQGAQVADGPLADLVRRGLVTPPRLPKGTRPLPAKRVASLEEVLRELDQDRADRDLP